MTNEFTTRLPLPIPLPDSLRIADAAKWYCASVPLIATVLDTRPDYEEPFSYAWGLKSRLRLAAALALYDQEFVVKFLEAFPLPPQKEVLRMATLLPVQTEGEDAAITLLLTISESEYRAFPGTVEECIDLELWDGKQQWIMTEDGWAAKS